MRKLSICDLLDYVFRVLKSRYWIPRIRLSLLFKAAVEFGPIVKFVDGPHVLKETLHLLVEIGACRLRLLEN